MKKIHSVAVVALSSLFALSMLAACKDGDTPPGEGDNEVGFYARICYDNLNTTNSYLNEADTKITVAGNVDKISAKDAAGTAASANAIATYDSATKTFTAVSGGTVDFELDGAKSRIEVVPAYVTNPGNQYGGPGSNDLKEDSSTQLGNTHDPSFIEREEGGKTVYYLFSTGWENKSTYNEEETYGNAIHRSEDGMATWEFVGRTFKWDDRDEMLEESGIGDWLYGDGTKLSTVGDDKPYSKASAGWWAPDIVPAKDGGYWLYSCVVDGSGGKSGMLIDGERYARAACMLFWSDDLYQGSFEYKGVLMQSSIQRGESVRDVNGIDPQIIYTPEGKMYMAYGSFGSGNWMIELDPETGLRKDGKNDWQTHETIRNYVENDVQDFYQNKKLGQSHEYYGTYISVGDMEAPVIARHDNVKITDETSYDETGALKSAVEGKTYYYSMHSYYGLDQAYQMWGGRSESVTGVYKSATGEGNVMNYYPFDNSDSQGNKYMGAFTWSNKSSTASKEINIILPGHNDLFTSKYGTNLAAYITRTLSYSNNNKDHRFLTQVHQYYLNSMGDICINPNRYGKEIDRSVSKEELLAYTDGGKFQMVAFKNDMDTVNTSDNFTAATNNISKEVVLDAEGNIKYQGSNIGTWLMYGKGYIKFTFNANTSVVNNETVFYGVVRPAWLGNQNKSGFTITCMSHTPNSTRSMAMFMNAQSTITGDDLVG
ncbi:MAG: hypothetical protein K2L02_00540 [Clostridia bacterium]|nr:hypothetical protein [Clostridia bacterium]